MTLEIENVLPMSTGGTYYVIGTCVATPMNSTVVVNIHGTEVTLPHLRGYVPAVNDSVLVMVQGTQRIVVDAVTNPSDPIGNREGAPIPTQPTPTQPISPISLETVSTRTFVALATADYANGAWRTDTRQPHQGDSGNGLNTGVWFYGRGINTALNGSTVTSAKIYLRRTAGGVYTSIAPTVYLVTQATKPDVAPTLIGSPVTLSPIPYDSEGWIDLPVDFVQQLANGNAFGLAVYSPTANPYMAFSSLAERRQSGALQITYRSETDPGGGGSYKYGQVFSQIRSAPTVSVVGSVSSNAQIATFSTVKASTIITKPVGTVVGDVLIAIHYNDTDGALVSMTAPAGWTLQGSSFTGTSGFCKIWYKVATASEPATYDFGAASGSENAVILLRAIGINQTTPFLANPSFISATGPTTSHDAPSVSATAEGVLVCSWQTQVPVVANNWTVPTDMIPLGDLSQPADWVTAIAAYMRLSANVASGVRTATSTSMPAGTFGDIGVSFILNPSGTGGGGGGGGTIPGAFMMGASGVAVANGEMDAWLVNGPLQIGGTWADTPAAQTEQYSTTPGSGEFGSWTRALDIAVGAIFKQNGETWANAAAGNYDSRWQTIADKLKSNLGSRDPRYWFVNFAREMNGSWSDWNVQPGEEANFRTAYGRFQNILKATIPGIKTILVYNDGSDTGCDTDAIWPTATPPDVLGVDTYNAWPHVTDQTGWNTKINLTEGGGRPAGIETWRQKALSRGVPIAFPEFGNPGVNDGGGGGGGDDPYWLQQMLTYCQSKAGTGAGQVMYAIYFNIGVNGGYSPDYILFAGSSGYTIHQPLNREVFRTIARSIGAAPPPPPPPPPPTTSGFPSPAVGLWYFKWNTPTLGGFPSDVQTTLNYVMMAFAETTSAGTGSVGFSGYTGYSSDAQIKADVVTMKARGINVAISIGGSGSNGLVKLQNSTHRSQMLASVQSMVNTFGFNGVDFDMEDPNDWTPSEMAAFCGQLKGYFGQNFIVGMTMGLYGTLGENWRSAAVSAGSNCDYYAPMLYDFPEAGDSRLTGVAQDKIDYLAASGLPKSKIILAFMLRVNAESYPNASPLSVAQTAWNTAKANNPTLRGAFLWEHARDARSSPSWPFVRNIGTSIRG